MIKDTMEENKEALNPSPDFRNADPRTVALEAALALYRKKGIDIKMFRVTDTTVIADYYVICTGRASTHLRALADEADYRLGLGGLHAYRTEGDAGSEWLLIDFGSVLVHVFSREAREYYHLERLLDPASEVELQEFFDEMQSKLTEKEGSEA